MRQITILLPIAVSVALIATACSTGEAEPPAPAEVQATSDATVDTAAPIREVAYDPPEGRVTPATEVAARLVEDAEDAEAGTDRPADTEDGDPAAEDAVAEATPAGTRFNLQRGETLAHFARWAELPVESIADASSLDLDGRYPVGTEIRVPLDPQGIARVRAARADHRTARVEGYLARRGGAAGVDAHTVRSGESAWAIARDTHGIPVWVLEAYNPEVNLDRLRPGQSLSVPVLADVTADAAEEPEVDLLADEDTPTLEPHSE